MVYYNYTNGGILLKAVEVNWRNEDPSLRLPNAMISAWCRGANYDNERPVTASKSRHINPTRGKKNTGFTTPVKTTEIATVGGKSDVTISRGSSSWELTPPVNIYH